MLESPGQKRARDLSEDQRQTKAPGNAPLQRAKSGCCPGIWCHALEQHHWARLGRKLCSFIHTLTPHIHFGEVLGNQLELGRSEGFRASFPSVFPFTSGPTTKKGHQGHECFQVGAEASPVLESKIYSTWKPQKFRHPWDFKSDVSSLLASMSTGNKTHTSH